MLEGLAATHAGLEHLEVLFPVKTNYTDQGLQAQGGLSKLSELDLRGLPITDNSIHTLSQTQSLSSPDLKKTHITPNGIERHKRTLFGCRILHDE